MLILPCSNNIVLNTDVIETHQNTVLVPHSERLKFPRRYKFSVLLCLAGFRLSTSQSPANYTIPLNGRSVLYNSHIMQVKFHCKIFLNSDVLLKFPLWHQTFPRNYLPSFWMWAHSLTWGLWAHSLSWGLH